VTSITAEFPEVPQRYCDNHFLRDVAKPLQETDSHAQVPMRRKVRGLRTIEQAMLKQQRQSPQDPPTVEDLFVVGPIPSSDEVVGQNVLDSPTVVDPPAVGPIPSSDEGVGQVVLDYCAAVRGILNDDQGGPLYPTGLRIAKGLTDVCESIQKNLATKREVRRDATPAISRLHRSRVGPGPGGASDPSRLCQEIGEVAAMLDPRQSDAPQRKEKFAELTTRFQEAGDPMHRSMTVVMISFVAGLLTLQRSGFSSCRK